MTRHIVLIGAARSGTKILRDVLSQAAGVGAVPYDIPFVWRDGHDRAAGDRLDPDSLTPGNSRFIASYVDKYCAGDPPAVVEKTVGNALRVPYVHRVFPDADFVHLIRDGLDVVESTSRQWTAPADHRYLVGKLRHFPVRRLPTYGFDYVRSQMKRSSAAGHVASWGVRYPGMQQDLLTDDLLTVCARQWRWCVDTATEDFNSLGINPVQVQYEDFVERPAETLERVCDDLRLVHDAGNLAEAATRVRSDRAGVGSKGLNAERNFRGSEGDRRCPTATGLLGH